MIISSCEQLNLRKKSKHVRLNEQCFSFAGDSHTESSPKPNMAWDPCSISAIATTRTAGIRAAPMLDRAAAGRALGGLRGPLQG